MNGERGGTAGECYGRRVTKTREPAHRGHQSPLSAVTPCTYLQRSSYFDYPGIGSFATRHSVKHRSSPRSLIKGPALDHCDGKRGVESLMLISEASRQKPSGLSIKGLRRFLAAQSRGVAPRLERVLGLDLGFRLLMMLSRFRDTSWAWLIGVRTGYGVGVDGIWLLVLARMERLVAG